MKTKKINIPLSDQVVERKISKGLTEKLASVGIEVESAFYWTRCKGYHGGDSGERVYSKRWEDWGISHTILKSESKDVYQSLPAPTLPELLAVLPCYIEILGEIFFRAIYGNHLICYESGDTKTRLTNQKGKIDDKTSPATAAAKLLIWCIDNGYIKGGGE